MEIQSLFKLLMVYLAIYFMLKVFFALSEREKKPKDKPQKIKKESSTTVKQDLISKKQLQKEQQKQEKKQALAHSAVMFKYESLEDNPIDKYLAESKQYAHMEKTRLAREELLQNNNPHASNENITNDWFFNNSALGIDEGREFNDHPRERAHSPMPTRFNHPFLSDFANKNFTNNQRQNSPLTFKNASFKQNKYINDLLKDMENSSAQPISSEFKKLPRDMQIFIITKLINKEFK